MYTLSYYIAELFLILTYPNRVTWLSEPALYVKT